MRAAAAFALLCLGCTSAQLAPPVVRTRVGPAFSQPIDRIVALRATCGALASLEVRPKSEAGVDPSISSDAVTCSPSQIEGADAAIRSALAFRGYNVVDSEAVNATTLARTEREVRQRSGSQESATREIELRGARFLDATPAVQDAILAELGAEAILNARIWVGAGMGASGRRDVEVLIRMLHVPSGELAWATHCRVEAGMVLNEQPIMEAVRCALEAVAAL